jgi:hypothetical protein
VNSGAYGKLMLVEKDEKNIPILTFSHPEEIYQSLDMAKLTKTASEAYLTVICSGLSKHLSKSEITDYIVNLDGIKVTNWFVLFFFENFLLFCFLLGILDRKANRSYLR